MYGSSPRMWGTRQVRQVYSARGRFIPTHVGNTFRSWNGTQSPSVHPHACGEHHRPRKGCCTFYGSSPRMWGTRAHGWSGPGSHRFIPTHVGNTSPTVALVMKPPVHPHACGEHHHGLIVVEHHLGSSPRMWGTRRPLARLAAIRRFIPTHVGNTPLLSKSERILCGSFPTHVGNTAAHAIRFCS